MSIIQLISILTSFMIILPIIYMIYYKLYFNNSLLFYLLVGLVVEMSLYINYFFIHKNSTNLTIIYSTFEVLFILYYYKNSISRFYFKSLQVISILYSIMLLFELTGVLHIKYELFMGVNKAIILSISLAALINGISNNISKTNKFIIFGFLQYSLLTVSTFSFANFFIINSEYTYFYVLLNSISNLLLYSLITAALYIQKSKEI